MLLEACPVSMCCAQRPEPKPSMRRVLSLISRPSLNRSNLLLPPILRLLPKFFTEPKPPAEVQLISICVSTVRTLTEVAWGAMSLMLAMSQWGREHIFWQCLL